LHRLLLAITNCVSQFKVFTKLVQNVEKPYGNFCVIAGKVKTVTSRDAAAVGTGNYHIVCAG